MKHLDSEYRNKREEYITSDTLYDSREINWRDVPWDKVQEVRIIIKDNIHMVNNTAPIFKSLMRWRWGGRIAQFDENGKPIAPQKINIWCIGWTDGETCYMKEVDFHSGELLEEKEYPLEMFKSHIHPDVEEIING